MEPEPEVAIFIVRALREAGSLSGVIERVRTGEKVRFQGGEAIGRIIARIVEAEAKDASRDEEDAPGRNSP